MKGVIQLFALSVFVSFFISCGNSGQTTGMKKITGRPGELVMIINNEIWEGTVDSIFTEVLAQSQLGLPQGEPIFNLITVPFSAFADIFKTSRNLLMVKVGDDVDSSGVYFTYDKYASPQAVAIIEAKSKENLLPIFMSNSDKIIGFFLKSEKERLMSNYAKYREKLIDDKAKELFSISINVPPGFTIAASTADFMWARYETPEISQGIFIYSVPYVSDSTFTSDFLKVQRNIFLKNNVPGPTKGSYMTTDTEMPLLFNTTQKDGNYAAEMRGLWRVENDFMGGPFVSLSVLDLLKKRVVTIDGYVYAPGKDKRNLLRQVEAMIYSAQFVDQKDMDKLNRQFE
jgi:hypothetical protein